MDGELGIINPQSRQVVAATRRVQTTGRKKMPDSNVTDEYTAAQLLAYIKENPCLDLSDDLGEFQERIENGDLLVIRTISISGSRPHRGPSAGGSKACRSSIAVFPAAIRGCLQRLFSGYSADAADAWDAISNVPGPPEREPSLEV